jgi:hypothetical protein
MEHPGPHDLVAMFVRNVEDNFKMGLDQELFACKLIDQSTPYIRRHEIPEGTDNFYVLGIGLN